jgi:hypothetical protein
MLTLEEYWAMRFFTVSFDQDEPRYPRISWIKSGCHHSAACKICGVRQVTCDREIEALLQENQGESWPDCLAATVGPTIVISERVLAAWRADGIGEVPHNRVTIQPPIPPLLRGKNKAQPNYFWVSNDDIQGAKIDYEASGFLYRGVCTRCGGIIDDLFANLKLWKTNKYPYVFVEGSWNGAKLFCAGPTLFCTEEVVTSVARHKLTNFRFTPIEEGPSAGLDALMSL